MKNTATKTIVCIGALLLAGCAQFTVRKVSTNPKDPGPNGIRYSLPKPVIQVTPQEGGTVSVEVIYLPDSEHTYAISAGSWMSSYTSQVLVNQSGFLTAVEFKENTGGLAQQMASSAGAAAAQVYNLKAAQLSASQTVANTAQTSLDTARSGRDQAQAQLDADIAAGTTTAVNTDRVALAKAQAQFDDAQQVLNRAHSTAQFASVTAASATPLAATTPTASSSGFALPTWSNPSPHPLPENYGPVLYAVKEIVNDTGPHVSLVTIRMKVDENEKTKPPAQPVFETAAVALPPPGLGPSSAAVIAGSDPATFVFTRQINAITSSTINSFTNPPKAVVPDAKAALNTKDKVTLSLPVDRLPSGQYYLNVGFNYFNSSTETEAHVGTVNIAFTVK